MCRATSNTTLAPKSGMGNEPALKYRKVQDCRHLLTTYQRAWCSGIVHVSLQLIATAGTTTEVGSGVVTATSSFARALTARDGHLTPTLPRTPATVHCT